MQSPRRGSLSPPRHRITAYAASTDCWRRRPPTPDSIRPRRSTGAMQPRRQSSLCPGLDQVGEGQLSVNADELRVVRGFGMITSSAASSFHAMTSDWESASCQMSRPSNGRRASRPKSVTLEYAFAVRGCRCFLGRLFRCRGHPRSRSTPLPMRVGAGMDPLLESGSQALRKEHALEALGSSTRTFRGPVEPC